MEIFKDIKGYEGLYQVSNLGNVKSFYSKWGLLKGNKGSGGYLAVGLSKKKIIKTFRIHQLVAIAFLGHTPNGFETVVDHINNNQLDNRVENLKLTTNRYNTSKDKKNKTSKYTGVSWSKSANKWITHIKINGKSKHLGLFINEIEASNAYQKALLTLND